MKGQVKIEFVLGVVVFGIIIFYVAAQINSVFLSTTTDAKLDILKAKSITLLEVITKNPDTGLALSRNNLNKTKIALWMNSTPPCSEPGQMGKYQLRGYRLSIYEKDEPKPILFCGYAGTSTIRTHVVRAVKITNETTGVTNYGNLTLEMW